MKIVSTRFNQCSRIGSRIARLTTIAALGFALTTGISFADVKRVSDAELTMDENLSYDIHKTLYFLRFGHYSPKTLDDDYSSRILDSYLKDLDPNKIYFTQKDIDKFDAYRFKLDDYIKRRDAEVAFEIFKTFRQRLSERTEHIMASVSYTHLTLPTIYSV